MKVFFRWVDSNPDGPEDRDIIAELDGKSHPLPILTAMDSIPEIFEEHIGRKLTSEEEAWCWKLTELPDNQLTSCEF